MRIHLTIALLAMGCAPKPDPSSSVGAADSAPARADSAQPPSAAEPNVGASIPGVDWRWVRIVTLADTIRAPAQGRYQIRLGSQNRLTGWADCNRMSGSYQFDGRTLTFSPIATTKIGCPPGGLGDRFAQWIQIAESARLQAPDTLLVELKVNSGTMWFAR